MAIRAVVFDIGGVLEITPRTGWEGKWEARLHLKAGELNDRLRDMWRGGSLGELSEEEVEKRVGETLGLDRAGGGVYARPVGRVPGGAERRACRLLRRPAPRYRTAIIGNSFAGVRGKEQERYGFADMCDLIIYSHEEGLRKPDRRIFELACERLGVQPVEMVFLDDVEESVAAARELGIHTILFKETAQAIAGIEACLRVGEPQMFG
jgi:FMN phosphatase YigB (HAD superfamily)